ncbi:DgyrCDS9509 [Dimorphilus gyrociliatus]|uniref:DgyrCDS9509 n=1 Tax=Dimorphilus gyrociliatus TaxID=2664684 RepID=A0A7I8VZX0_9ANNE|nr:DgyrCDS9509 [Dimorphilus gyrociliatus]
MLNTVRDILKPANNKVILDMTFGSGGHSLNLLKQAPEMRIIAADRDSLANSIALDCNNYMSNILPIKSKFSQLKYKLIANGVLPSSLDGVLIDCGVSSMQLDDAERGFSFIRDGPLNMSMDNPRKDKNEQIKGKKNASFVVNHLNEKTLSKIIRKYGEERHAKLIAKRIVENRLINSTLELADVISSAIPRGYGSRKELSIHPATRTFQAIRIYVNDELNELNSAIECAHLFLNEGCPCVAISFHSLEDRIVKRHFHSIDFNMKNNLSARQQMILSAGKAYTHSMKDIKNSVRKGWKPLSRKIFNPDMQEILANPRSRSAKLRAATKELL